LPRISEPAILAFHRSRPTRIRFDLKRVMLAIDLDDELFR
jgi:hypothetical protein